MSGREQSRVRLVLFDVFDTLCTPRLPIHEQYHEEAVRAGISPASISPASVRTAFRAAFKELNTRHPLYGKHSSSPLTPEEWWTGIIRATILHAGADPAELDACLSSLAPQLLERFESDRGYRNFPETLHVLRELNKLGVKTSVVSNADPRINRTLKSLGILDVLSQAPTLSWDVEVSKPDPNIFRAACKSCGEDPGRGVIMVGDELVADYNGALSASLEARLIRREGEWSDGAVRAAAEDLSAVQTVTSLSEVLEEVRRRNVPQAMS